MYNDYNDYPTLTTVQIYEIAIGIAKEMSTSVDCDYFQCEERDINTLVCLVEALCDDRNDRWANEQLVSRYNQKIQDVIWRHVNAAIRAHAL